MLTHEFEVIVRRVKEGQEQSPDELFRATSISVGADGHLQIGGETCGRAIKSDLWESFEVKQITTTR